MSHDQGARRGQVALVLGLGLVLAYAGLCHWLVARYPASALSQVTVLGPMTLLGAVGLWKDGLRVAALVLISGVGALIALCANATLPVEWLYLVQHAGVQAGLGWWFGRTLRAGREPFISGLAARVHRGLTPEMAVYTRGVTQLWTGCFLLLAVLSLLLFVLAPLSVWSVFANLVSPLSALALFIGEYLWRYRRHPEFERATLLDAVRAYQDSARNGGSA